MRFGEDAVAEVDRRQPDEREREQQRRESSRVAPKRSPAAPQASAESASDDRARRDAQRPGGLLDRILGVAGRAGGSSGCQASAASAAADGGERGDGRVHSPRAARRMTSSGGSTPGPAPERQRALLREQLEAVDERHAGGQRRGAERRRRAIGAVGVIGDGVHSLDDIGRHRERLERRDAADRRAVDEQPAAPVGHAGRGVDLGRGHERRERVGEAIGGVEAPRDDGHAPRPGAQERRARRARAAAGAEHDGARGHAASAASSPRPSVRSPRRRRRARSSAC